VKSTRVISSLVEEVMLTDRRPRATPSTRISSVKARAPITASDTVWPRPPPGPPRPPGPPPAFSSPAKAILRTTASTIRPSRTAARRMKKWRLITLGAHWWGNEPTWRLTPSTQLQCM